MISGFSCSSSSSSGRRRSRRSIWAGSSLTSSSSSSKESSTTGLDEWDGLDAAEEEKEDDLLDFLPAAEILPEEKESVDCRGEGEGKVR